MAFTVLLHNKKGSVIISMEDYVMAEGNGSSDKGQISKGCFCFLKVV